MKSYAYSEARGNLATVLDEGERDGAVEIRRRDGLQFSSCLFRRSDLYLFHFIDTVAARV